MIYNLILLFLSIVPIILLGSYVYFKDKDKEPNKLLLKLFIGGILAAALTIVLNIFIRNIFPFFKQDYTVYNQMQLFLYTFIIVGLVEFDQLYDMIVYSVFIALGFALVENVLYVYDGGLWVALVRLFVAVPGHVSMSIFMGYYLSFAKLLETQKKKHLKKKYILLSILIPSIFHGIYDYCILSGHLIFLFFFLIFIIILFYQANTKLIKLSRLDINLQKQKLS